MSRPQYECAESGLTDTHFGMYAELLAIMRADGFKYRHRRDQALEIMLELRAALFGDTFDDVKAYIEGHADSCEGCKQQYNDAMRNVTKKASAFWGEDQMRRRPDSRAVI